MSEVLQIMPYVEDKFSNYVPFLELVAFESDEVTIGDNKKDRIVSMRAKKGEDGKVKFYCEADDNTDYCPHTAFAAALPQVRNALRR